MCMNSSVRWDEDARCCSWILRREDGARDQFDDVSAELHGQGMLVCSVVGEFGTTVLNW